MRLSGPSVIDSRGRLASTRLHINQPALPSALFSSQVWAERARTPLRRILSLVGMGQ